MSIHLNHVGKSEVRSQHNLKISDRDRERIDRQQQQKKRLVAYLRSQGIDRDRRSSVKSGFTWMKTPKIRPYCEHDDRLKEN